MKNLFKSMMAIAVAAMSFTACSNDLTEDVTPSQEFTVQINAVENLSRTHFGDLNEGKYPTLWDATDKVKASLNMTTAKNSTETTIAVDGTTASFKLSLNESTAPYTIYAISPANVASSISSEYSNWTITIPDSQEPDATTCDPAAQVVVGQTEALDILPSSVDMKFEHLTAYAKINFTNVTPLGDAVVNSITITADQYIAGKHYYQVADNGSYTAGQLRSAGGAVKSITITTSELNNVWVALAPTTVSELTFTINTDQGPITKEVTGLNKVFKSGVVATFNVNMIGKTIEKADKYTLVTDLSVLAEGDNVIIASADADYAISTDNSGTYRNATAITKDGNTIIPTATVGIFTVHDAGTNLYAFKEASDEKYLYASSSSSNYLQTQATNDANGYWDITINDATGAAKVVAQGTNTRNVMQYNYNDGNPRFSCYAGTQKDVALYYKSNGGAKIAIDPQIIASDINDVAAEGVTNATAEFTAKNLTEAITVTCDGIIVTAASVSGNVLTYTVAANEDEAREGWIKLAANGVEVTITVSQLAPISGDTATGTIDFSTTDQRTSLSSDAQVWENAGITFTNAKASSQSDVADFSNPARFYKSSSITISAPSNITKLYFECSSAEYATALKNSVGSAATASGTNVTVVLDGTSDTFTATLSVGKVFVNSLSVTYISTGQEIQTLSFDSTAVEATLGQPFTAPTLTGAMTDVTYSSSNEAVATVDANGAVTLVTAGETTITATAEATEDYFSATASYTLTVIDPNATVDYTTLNTSNVTLSTDGGTSASTAKVKVDGHEYDAIKLGTSKKVGAWKVTVPAGTTKLHLHLAGWNGESVKVGVTGATVNKSSLSLISDSGITGNSPFTLNESSSTFYHELTLSNVTAATTLTFTATSGYRFVVWGVNAE